MRFQVSQWLLGATDGHAKNYSMFIQAGGSYQLTPFYDILSAFPVPGGAGLHIRDLKLAMSLKATKGRKSEIHQIYPRHFFATAKEVNFAQEQMEQILHDFADNVPHAVEKVMAALPAGFSAPVADAISTNMMTLHARLIANL
jgi:serine/threonine-protein kinase HipA